MPERWPKIKDKWPLILLGLGTFLPLAVGAAPAPQSSQGSAAAASSQASQPASSSADVNPLVAAARKAREQKAQQPTKTLKVYTNDDLSGLKGAGVSVVGEAPAPLAAADTSNAAADKDKTAATGQPGPKDEAAWRARFAQARRNLADDTRELDILQREFNLKQQQYYSDPNEALREQNDRKDLDDTQAKIDAKKAAVEKDQQAITDLEDALRQAGGDPGWAVDENAAPESLPAQPPSDGQPAQP